MMIHKYRNSQRTGLILVALAALLALSAVPSFRALYKLEPLYPGSGVTEQKMLSTYFPGLKDSPGDTEVYIMDSGRPGGTVLVLGGVHPDEPSPYLVAVMLIEQTKVTEGRLIVIPRSNRSGFTHTLPGEASPTRFPIQTAGGTRWFEYGARSANPTHSWPDQEVYVHYPSGQRLSGEETRNLNRAFPGRAQGTLIERVAYGISELIRKERVDLTIDLHEAMPEYPNINVLVAHENAMELAATAQFNMMFEGMNISLSPSPTNYHGLSHRELGDYTDTMSVLMEAPTVSIGRLRGRTTVNSIIKAKDDFYVWGGKLGRLFAPFTDEGWPIETRIARHATGVKVLCDSLGELIPEKSVIIEGLPSYAELVQNAGKYFHPPAQ